ncbi:MAG: sugar ABC transporter substrate-binding protein [Deinococcus sp.]|nr:sugar ABC transporter substrate-binding protein [Deinococcus sp.]
MKHVWIIGLTAAIGVVLSLSQAQQPPLVIAMWTSPELDNLRKIEPIYEERSSQALEIEEIARDVYQQVVFTNLLTNSGRFDVVYGDTAWLPALVQAGVVQSLTPFITDPNVADPNLNLAEKSTGLDATTFNGEIYGFPSEGDTTYLFYRTDLFQEAGLSVPNTWDEFLATARALTQDTNGDGRVDQYGVVDGPNAAGNEAFWNFQQFFYAFGAEFLDQNLEPVVNRPAGVASLEFFVNLVREGLMPPDVATYTYTEKNIAFQQGNVAMMVQWIAAVAELADCSRSPLVCDKFSIAPVPGRLENGQLVREAGASQWAWFIPAASMNQVAAYKFIEWLTSVEGATLWAINGGIPTNTTVLSNPQVVERTPLMHFRLLAEVFGGRNVPPKTTVTPELAEVFSQAVAAAVAGTKTPQQALDDANAQMRTILVNAGLLPAR